MKNLKKGLKITLVVYGILGFLFLLFQLSPLEITNAILKQLIYESVLFGMVPFFLIIGIWIAISLKSNLMIKGIAGLSMASLPFILHFTLGGFGIIGLFWHSHSVWEDLEILATHKTDDSKIVVKQLIDSGAFGYGKRIVIKNEITSWLCWCEEIYDPELLDENWDIIDQNGFGF